MQNKTTVAARFAAVLLSLAMLMTLLPVTAFAVEAVSGPSPSEGQSESFAFGSGGTVLEEGTYEVPVFLRKYNKHAEKSAAATAFPEMAQLTVHNDGTAELRSEIQAVSMSSLTDRAYDIKYYPDDGVEGQPVPVNVLQTVTKDQNMVNPGKEVPSEISFPIPSRSMDGVYLNFYVDAMGTAPDAWLEIDYSKAALPGGVRVYKGKHEVFQFGQYDISVEVSVQNGVITNADISADRYCEDPDIVAWNQRCVEQVTTALKSAWNGLEPTQENAEAIYNVIYQNDVADAVSGATYSAKGVRDTIMEAFELEYERPIEVPESIAPGRYEVEVAYYAEVGHHSLIENDTAKAQLKVGRDGTMQMDLKPISGTEKEPMYIMNLNGVYPDNNRENALTMEGCRQSKQDIAFEDQFFSEETQVVRNISIPLNGGLQKIYYTNMYLYVPAMNNLNGVLHGVSFENGNFNTDICTKVYWDTLKKLPSGGGSSRPVLPQQPDKQPEPTPEIHFTDVPENHWASESIALVAERKLFEGTGEGTFAPSVSMDRGMFITVLGRLAGVEDGNVQDSVFSDVSSGAYYAPYVAWGVRNGIVSGTSETTFSPERRVSRQEMAAFLARYAESAKISLKDSGTVSFADANEISAWAVEDVDRIARAGLMQGVGENCFAPANTASRAEVAVLLARFVQGYSL